jgi:BirA family biotin operon repressor/biotin-[acetyl-CoA-carboxylase] ligase
LLPTARITLKWPNDVLIEGKKLSGILLDAGPLNDGKIDWLIAGMGLNVESHPAESLFPSTSLREEGATPPPLRELLETLLGHFSEWRKDLGEHGFPLIRSVWMQRSIKGQMSVKLPSGTVNGEFVGVDDNGSLVLQLADGTKQVISAGDVFFPN